MHLNLIHTSHSYDHFPLNTNPQGSILRFHHRRGSSLPLRLQSYECPFNWAKHYPLSPTEISHGLLLLEEKFHDESAEIQQLLGKSSTNNNSYLIQITAKKLIQAYFNIELASFSQARQCLAEAEKFISSHSTPGSGSDDDLLFPPDYAQGFTYIIEGIRLFLEIQINAGTTTETSSSKLLVGTSKPVSLDGLKHFKRLPAKAKYIVWTARDVFFLHCSRSNVERAGWMEAILEIEPYIPKWHFYLYRALHSSRKLVPRPALVLEGRTVTSWQQQANDHDDDDDDDFTRKRRKKQQHQQRHYPDPLSISYQAMCITQMFMERRTVEQPETGTPSPSNRYPWRFGKTLFDSAIQVLASVHEKTIQVLEMDCHLDGVYLNFAEIHMFILSPEHQNMELALRCLKKALRLNSTNPKTHYRMGLAHLKLKNHKQSISHFREAIRSQSQSNNSHHNPNIGAIFGLLQLLMADPHSNSAEIHSILKYAMRNNRVLTQVWDKRCLRTLHYLKGCFHFMEQDVEEAITSWIIAHDNESPKWSFYFHNLSHQSTRFNWPTKRLNLTNVSKALKHVAYLEQTRFRPLLLDICSEVDDAIRRDERKLSSSTTNSF